MKLSNFSAIIITFAVSAILYFLKEWLKKMGIVIPTWIIGLIGVSGLIYVAIIEIVSFYRRQMKINIVFKNNFSNFEGWVNIPPGGVHIDSSISHTGSAALKKYGANDPSGGYKKIDKIRRGFVFSGWIFRPTQNEEGGPADRLSIEDKKGDGYGFAIRHNNGSFFLIIEKRVEGSFDKNLERVEIKSLFNSLRGKWYRFDFQITKKDRLILNIDCDGNRIGHIKANDTDFKKFQRIAVRGGYPYYVDDLKITTT